MAESIEVKLKTQLDTSFWKKLLDRVETKDLDTVKRFSEFDDPLFRT